MECEIERKIERRDSGHRADREATHDSEASLRRREEVERHDIAADSLCFLRRDLDGENAAIRLDFGIADRLTGFQRDE
jgi:hypothetical protein